jgi:D-alanyl-D-alanine dipeptidase
LNRQYPSILKSNIIFFLSLILCSCNAQSDGSSIRIIEQKLDTNSNIKVKEISKSQPDSKIILANNLIDVQTINPTILIELKYATTDNFMKIKLYSRIDRAYLQKDVAVRLSACQDYLSELKPGYKLLIYDAIRPVSVQQKMWDALDSLPPGERGKFVSNPKKRSLHNLGAAVDITVCDEKGNPLDMGAGYDEIRKIAYPELESYFLKTGELTLQQIENRKLLRKVMRKAGFRNIPTEWWHFNACSRNQGLTKYKVLMEEP